MEEKAQIDLQQTLKRLHAPLISYNVSLLISCPCYLMPLFFPLPCLCIQVGLNMIWSKFLLCTFPCYTSLLATVSTRTVQRTGGWKGYRSTSTVTHFSRITILHVVYPDVVVMITHMAGCIFWVHQVAYVGVVLIYLVRASRVYWFYSTPTAWWSHQC